MYDDDATYDEDSATFDRGWCPRCGSDMAGEPPAALVCAGCTDSDPAGDDALGLPKRRQARHV